MWHRDRLENRGAQQKRRDPDEHNESLVDGEGVAALYKPPACAERKRRPLQRGLRNVSQQRQAIDTQRGTDRQHVEGQHDPEETVGCLSGELTAVRANHPEQQRPGQERQVVRKQQQNMTDARRRVTLRVKRRADYTTHGIVQSCRVDRE